MGIYFCSTVVYIFILIDVFWNTHIGDGWSKLAKNVIKAISGYMFIRKYSYNYANTDIPSNIDEN